MDSKLSSLDPKLKEAYERVMNGGGQTRQAPTPPPPGPANHTEPVPPISPTPTINSTPAQPVEDPPLDPTPAINSTIAYNAHNEGLNKGTTPVKKGGGMAKALLVGLVVLVLLAVYTFVWIFILKLKIPGLPF